MNSKLFRVRMLIGWIGVGILFYLSFTPNAPQIHIEKFGDKIGHFFAYFVLTSWFLWSSQRPFGLTAFAFIVLGLVIEFVQPLTGYRVFDLNDWLANVVAVLCVYVLSKTSYRNVLVAMETFLIRLRDNRS